MIRIKGPIFVFLSSAHPKNRWWWERTGGTAKLNPWLLWDQMGYLFSMEDLAAERLGHSLGWSFVCFCYYLYLQVGNALNIPGCLSPQIIKHRFPTWTQQYPREMKKVCPYNNWYMNVDSCAIHYCQKAEMTQMSINGPLMDKMCCSHQWNIIWP